MDKGRGGIRFYYFTVCALGIENIVWFPRDGLLKFSEMLSVNIDRLERFRLNTAS